MRDKQITYGPSITFVFAILFQVKFLESKETFRIHVDAYNKSLPTPDKLAKIEVRGCFFYHKLSFL